MLVVVGVTMMTVVTILRRPHFYRVTRNRRGDKWCTRSRSASNGPIKRLPIK